MRAGDAICSECGRELQPWKVTELRCPLHPRARAYYVEPDAIGWFATPFLRVDFR